MSSTRYNDEEGAPNQKRVPRRGRSYSESETTPLMQAPMNTTLQELLASSSVNSSNNNTDTSAPATKKTSVSYWSLPFFTPTAPSKPDPNQRRESPLHTSSSDNPLAQSSTTSSHQTSNNSKSRGNFFVYLIYALVNVIIAVPGLYGYAAVIFNHSVFQPHMNALAKLVIFSSLMHQLGFLLFSSLDFAIGTVQDAGLIFLSSMSNALANRMLDDGDSEQAIVSTTLVLLSSGTALLGLCLFVIGKFQLANAVSYLPMPVIGGYLAFIGYFCVQAGVALCISQPLISFFDWKYLFQGFSFILALPGLLAALVLTIVSRVPKSDTLLPLCMVLIPALFYVVLVLGGWTLDDAREAGWVGQVAPPTPIQDVLALVDISLVRWDLIGEILWTWAGMVFVVSFASCLDVAAISMDMGEALDTNRELATVGICNFLSGLSLGFTGS